MMRPEVRWIVAAILLITAAASINISQAAELKADYNRVIDGDTVNLDVWLTGSLIQRGNVRLQGIDTPELRGHCAREKGLAKAARDYLDQALAEAKDIMVETITWSDKYGRPVMRIYADGEDMAEKLISAGMGRPYDGGRRAGWCD